MAAEQETSEPEPKRRLPDKPELPQRRNARIGRMIEDPALGRRVFLTGTAVAVTLTTLATIIFTVMSLTSTADIADRLAAAADVITGATLVLAVIAAIVALLAYAVSTGAPDLEVSVIFPFSRPNNPSFDALVQVDSQGNATIQARSFKQVFAEIRLRNKNGYSAKNPAVIVRLAGMGFRNEDRDWIEVDFGNMIGVTAVQWDGGPAYSIHGHSTRRLPTLHLKGLHAEEEYGDFRLIVEILADGYRRQVVMTVDLVVDGESHNPKAADTQNPDWM